MLGEGDVVVTQLGSALVRPLVVNQLRRSSLKQGLASLRIIFMLILNKTHGQRLQMVREFECVCEYLP